MPGFRVVAFGGGEGPALAARAFPEDPRRFTAVVGTTDRGSGTGRLRAQLGIPATGDIRHVFDSVAAFWGDTAAGELFERRIVDSDGPPSGMALGNLLLAALTLWYDRDFSRGARAYAKVLGLPDVALPACAVDVDVCARLADGSWCHGELAVRHHDKARIDRVYLCPERAANPDALSAIEAAEVIIVGPGSLPTSVLPSLLPSGIGEALAASAARKILIANTLSEPGLTEGLTPAEHVELVLSHLPADAIDAVLLPADSAPARMTAAYRAQRQAYLAPSEADLRRIRSHVKCVTADIIERDWTGVRHIGRKLDCIRHDPLKLRHALERSGLLGR